MIPARKSEPERIQLNRTFDSISEMETHVANQYKGFRLVRYWPVQSFACIVEKIEVENKLPKRKK